MTQSWMMWAPSVLGVVFFFAFGATVGSFINVVVYRVPKGLGIVRPASACPACGTTLTWRENFPILGWLLLRGRCRFCKTPISPEYPIVETVVALLFAGLYALWYLDPGLVRSIGVDPAAIRPDWTAAGLARTWPIFVMHIALVGSLVAVTLIDARTFLIPISIPWFAAFVSMVVHPISAWWISSRSGLRGGHDWTIMTSDSYAWTGLAAGAVVGLVIAVLLLRAGVIKPSFSDYEEWEREAEERAKNPTTHPNEDDPAPQPMVVRLLLLTGPAMALMAVGFTVGMRIGQPMRAMLGGMAVGLIVGLALRARFGGATHEAGDPAFVRYPYARREMVREIVFLGPAIALGVIGFMLTRGAAAEPTLWIKALTGSVVGLLAGGGVVWAVRILGSLAFGKEAMGLGDVHLMAAVGAALGWADAVLAFFIAPFIGIAWTIAAVIARRGTGGTALPYGPHLAAATLVVLYAKPALEFALSMMMQRQIDLP